MNAGPDVERLISDWLTEEAPAHAPDRILDAAARTIDRTKQRRLVAAWRDTMTISLGRLAAAAAVVLAAIVGAGLLGRASVSVAAPATSTQAVGSPSPVISPPPTPSPTPVVALADGTYASQPQSAANGTALVNADAKLSAAERKNLIENVLGFKDVTSFVTTIELHGSSWRLLGTYDGRVPIVLSEATFTTIDDHTFVLREDLPTGMSGFRVVPSGDGFTLTSLTPVASEADRIVEKIVFESGTFTRVP